MFTSLSRVCLLGLVAAFAVSAGNSQPPEPKDPIKIPALRPSYTAFPDLKPPTYEKKEVKRPDGTVGFELEQKGAVPLPPVPEVAADAPPLQKVQFEKLQEGLAYIKSADEIIRAGRWNQEYFRDYIYVAVDVYRTAAELEEKLAKRVPWYEARVRKLKEFAKYMQLRYDVGLSGPEQVHTARYVLLQAEADLLKLKAEVEKEK